MVAMSDEVESVSGFGVRISNSLLQWLISRSQERERLRLSENRVGGADRETEMFVTRENSPIDTVVEKEKGSSIVGESQPKLGNLADLVPTVDSLFEEDVEELEELNKISELLDRFSAEPHVSSAEPAASSNDCKMEETAQMKCVNEHPNDPLACAKEFQAYSDCASKFAKV